MVFGYPGSKLSSGNEKYNKAFAFWYLFHLTTPTYISMEIL
jgi:hypothetical protein